MEIPLQSCRVTIVLVLLSVTLNPRVPFFRWLELCSNSKLGKHLISYLSSLAVADQSVTWYLYFGFYCLLQSPALSEVNQSPLWRIYTAFSLSKIGRVCTLRKLWAIHISSKETLAESMIEGQASLMDVAIVQTIWKSILLSGISKGDPRNQLTFLNSQ